MCTFRPCFLLKMLDVSSSSSPPCRSFRLNWVRACALTAPAFCSLPLLRQLVLFHREHPFSQLQETISRNPTASQWKRAAIGWKRTRCAFWKCSVSDGTVDQSQARIGTKRAGLERCCIQVLVRAGNCDIRGVIVICKFLCGFISCVIIKVMNCGFIVIHSIKKKLII